MSTRPWSRKLSGQSGYFTQEILIKNLCAHLPPTAPRLPSGANATLYFIVNFPLARSSPPQKKILSLAQNNAGAPAIS